MTALSASRRGPYVGVLARLLIMACVVCAVGLVSGRVATSSYGLTAVEALVVVPLLIVIVPRPFVACTLLIVVAASVFSYGVLPKAHLPGGLPFNLGDLFLAAAVGGTLWRRPWRGWPPAVRRVFVVFALLLALAAIPTLRLAVLGHVQARTALVGFKTLLYFGVAFTIALEFSRGLWWPLVNAAIAFSALVAILSLGAATSSGFGHLLTSFDPTIVTDLSANPTAAASTARIRVPGLLFVYAMSIPTLVAVLLVPDKWRSLRVAALLLMIAAIGVSLNRNMYFGAGIGLLVTLLLGGARLRHRVLIATATAVAALVLVISSTVMPAVTAQIGTRAKSALSSQVLSSGSAQARSDEFSHALDSISHHPWYGVGWLQPYGAYSHFTPRAGVEDLYLHLATDFGIPVVLTFLILTGVLLSHGVQRARTAARPTDGAFVAASVGAVTAVLLSCLVGTYLQDPGTMMTFGVACGLLLATALRAAPRRADAWLAAGAPPALSV